MSAIGLTEKINVNKTLKSLELNESVSIVGLRVLIVDDQEQNRNILEERIRVMGCIPILAMNGIEGLEIAKKEKLDLILLDIMMPEMNGIEVLKHLMAHIGLKTIPVLMITAVDDDETLTQCFKLGADDYIVKPFRSTVFNSRVSAILRRKVLQDERNHLLKDIQQSYESLRQAEQVRDALTNMVVHDLNNPLTGIIGRIELMLSNLKNSSADKVNLISNLKRMQSTTKYMAMLVQGILDAAKLDNNSLTVKIEALDCNKLIKEVYETSQLLAHSRNVKLNISLIESPIIIESDPTLLSRILHNLIGNAIKYSPVNTTVLCKGTIQNGECVVSVDDQGPGIPPHLREKIFERFYQIESDKPDTRSGVGLGLNFCKVAISRLGGRIWVDDGPYGKGASFKFSLALTKRQ